MTSQHFPTWHSVSLMCSSHVHFAEYEHFENIILYAREHATATVPVAQLNRPVSVFLLGAKCVIWNTVQCKWLQTIERPSIKYWNWNVPTDIQIPAGGTACWNKTCITLQYSVCKIESHSQKFNPGRKVGYSALQFQKRTKDAKRVW